MFLRHCLIGLSNKIGQRLPTHCRDLSQCSDVSGMEQSQRIVLIPYCGNVFIERKINNRGSSKIMGLVHPFTDYTRN